MTTERKGLIALLAVWLVSTVLCASLTSGGMAISNIFSNIISYVDDPHTPSIEAQFEPIKQAMSNYWFLASVTSVMALLTLLAIIVYLVTQRRVPRSWVILLAVIGGVACILLPVAAQLQQAILRVPVPDYRFASATRDSLLLETTILSTIGGLGGLLLVVALLMLIISMLRSRSEQTNKLSRPPLTQVND